MRSALIRFHSMSVRAPRWALSALAIALLNYGTPLCLAADVHSTTSHPPRTTWDVDVPEHVTEPATPPEQSAAIPVVDDTSTSGPLALKNFALGEEQPAISLVLPIRFEQPMPNRSANATSADTSWKHRFQCQLAPPTGHTNCLGAKPGLCTCPHCVALAQQIATQMSPSSAVVLAQDFREANDQDPDSTGTLPPVAPAADNNQSPPSESPTQGSNGPNGATDEQLPAGLDDAKLALGIRPITGLGIDIKQPVEVGEFGKEFPTDYAGKLQGSYESLANTGAGLARSWGPVCAAWTAPSFYHRPLYFQEPNLERYGHYHTDWRCQSALSAAHFFATIPTLPYQLASSPPCACVPTQGYDRPGNCNLHVDEPFPWSMHGLIVHHLGLTGLVFLAL